MVLGFKFQENRAGYKLSFQVGLQVRLSPADEVISKEEAEKIMMDNGALELMYNSTNSPGEGETQGESGPCSEEFT